MRLCRLLPASACVILMLLAGPTDAQEAVRSHAITIDDYFTQADIFQVALSPTQDWVAYSEGRWQEATNDRKSDLWLSTASNIPPQRLTSDRANDRMPQWDPEGRLIYFLGNRKREGETHPPFDGKTQVWRIAASGGNPEAVTRVEGGVDAFALGMDGKSLYYVVHHEKVQDDWSGLRSKYKSLEYGHGLNQLGQVWKLNLHSWRADKLIDDGRNIRDFAVSPDGKRVAMITTPDDKVVSFEGRSRVDVFEAATGKIAAVPDAAFRSKAPSPYGWLEHLAWSPDSQALAFNVIFDGYPAEIIIARWDGAPEPGVFKLPRPPGVHVRGYGSPVEWRSQGHDLCFLGEIKGRVHLYCAQNVQQEGTPEFTTLASGDVVVEAFSVSTDKRNPRSAAVLMATPDRFADIYLSLASASGPVRRTQVNPQSDQWKLPQLSVVSWKGANGDLVEGILELPPDCKPGAKVPLVVEIHGGPTTASYYKLQYWIYGRTLLPARGYAVLCPNYRGSTGYGDKFLTDLLGKENDVDVEDILRGVDALVERGIADPQRLAVSGWSNGGYLTNCLITKTNRFKAAISGAGIVDAIMEWGANDEPAYAMVFKRGLPWNAADNYHRASPTYHLDKVRTPTLIHVGGNDERCPPGHSRMLYRALKEYGHVPTELIVYPGESHGLMKYRNRRAKMEWDLAWLDRHVLGKGAGKR
jgi:dipeptidyl aminopeptidase/acylaminoacyl peptidase